MSNGDKKGFRLRRLDAPPPPPTPPPPAPEEEDSDNDSIDVELGDEAQTTPRNAQLDARTPAFRPAGASVTSRADSPPPESPRTGALFRSAAAALAYLGAVSSSAIATTAACRRGPEDRFWIEIAASPARAAPLATTAGGRVFQFDDGLWLATLPDGDLVRVLRRPPIDRRAVLLVRGDRVERLPHAEWPEHNLRALLAGTTLRTIAPRPRPEVVALLPATLARWVLGRSTALGLEVSLAPAERRPLLSDAPVAGIVWMTLRAPLVAPGPQRAPNAPPRQVPAAWIAALADLPGALVTYSATELGRLFIDVRCAPPVTGPLLDALGPEDETWVLGAPDAGHARVRRTADLVDGAALLPPPSIPEAPPPSVGPASLPVPLPMRLMPSSRPHPTDALLLDAKETGWLARYVQSRPLGEGIYVIGRGDVCLLLASAGIAAQIPFGTPLWRIGPAGLYVAHGVAFDPPLSEAARLRSFAIDDRHLVAVTRQGAWRFDLEALAPVWTLWVGEPPAVADVLPAGAEKRVLAMARSLEAVPSRVPLPREPALHPAADAKEREQLLQEAMAFEKRGELVEAARQRERAGDFQGAGRLYHRAALG